MKYLTQHSYGKEEVYLARSFEGLRPWYWHQFNSLSQYGDSQWQVKQEQRELDGTKLKLSDNSLENNQGVL